MSTHQRSVARDSNAVAEVVAAGGICRPQALLKLPAALAIRHEDVHLAGAEAERRADHERGLVLGKRNCIAESLVGYRPLGIGDELVALNQRVDLHRVARVAVVVDDAQTLPGGMHTRWQNPAIRVEDMQLAVAQPSLGAGQPEIFTALLGRKSIQHNFDSDFALACRALHQGIAVLNTLGSVDVPLAHAGMRRKEQLSAAALRNDIGITRGLRVLPAPNRGGTHAEQPVRSRGLQARPLGIKAQTQSMPSVGGLKLDGCRGDRTKCVLICLHQAADLLPGLGT